MSYKRRTLELIEADLKKKMVWVSGPRQVGKTTLSEEIANKFTSHYYNWDDDSDQKILKEKKLNVDAELWILDEIHKYKNWRNWLKGLYDKNKKEKKILVTGSARLDVFSRSGDSLQGRYFHYRLHPFTLSEFLQIPYTGLSNFEFKEQAGAEEALKTLMHFSGFPEPLIGQSDTDAGRWRLAYGRRLFRDDLRDLDLVKNLDLIQLLFEQLPNTVSSVLSVNSLREDLNVAFDTVKNWLGILDNLYATFRLSPWGSPKIKAVKKEQKLYLWDWARVSQIGPRFENMIAFHLLRLTHYVEDCEGKECELRYIRDETGKETDFVVLKEKKPWFIVECKKADKQIDKNLKYFHKRLNVPHAFQVHLEGQDDYEFSIEGGKKIRVIPAAKFLCSLP